MAARRSGKKPKSGRNKVAASKSNARSRIKTDLSVKMRIIAALVLAGALAASGWMVWFRQPAATPPVLPPNMDRLERTLVQMINKHAAMVRQYPRSARARGTLGLVYEANEMWPESSASFDQAAKLDSSNPSWGNHAAMAQYNSGQMDAAIRRWKLIAREHPRFAPLLHRLAYALLNAGQLDEADAMFRRCLSVTGDAPEILAGLAETQMQSGHNEAAVSLLNRAIKLDPNYKTAHYLLGLAYREIGQPNDAGRELNLGLNARVRFLADETTAQMPQYICGVSKQTVQAAHMRRAGQADQAIALLNRALAAHPDEPSVMQGLADAYSSNGQFDQALAILQRAERVGKNARFTSIKLARLMLAQSRFDEALVYADRAVQLAPSLGDSHRTRGRVLIRLHRLEDARDALLTSLRFDTRKPSVYATLAYVYMQLQDYDNAEKQLQTAARRNPDSVWNHVNLCAVSMQLGHFDIAEDALQNAQRLAPDRPSVRSLAAKLRRLRP